MQGDVATAFGNQPLPSNQASSQTTEAWQNIYGITNMNLIRQMQTAEGN